MAFKRSGVRFPSAPPLKKPPFTAAFLMDEGDGSEDLRQGFDYKAQADGSTPVPKRAAPQRQLKRSAEYSPQLKIPVKPNKINQCCDFILQQRRV